MDELESCFKCYAPKKTFHYHYAKVNAPPGQILSYYGYTAQQDNEKLLEYIGDGVMIRIHGRVTTKKGDTDYFTDRYVCVDGKVLVNTENT
jgi:hypothetical protein